MSLHSAPSGYSTQLLTVPSETRVLPQEQPKVPCGPVNIQNGPKFSSRGIVQSQDRLCTYGLFQGPHHMSIFRFIFKGYLSNILFVFLLLTNLC